ncbi:DUF4286 family protein [Pseudomonas sp. MWU13-2100]|uniref:DUF4286 family protein n=1 Tax=Pseudomonas sp. MWU13-2100 TaxID=2935075 RepID=UPI00200C982E|nr:DUF4286 family protein [Pseudomonas sp. MWU13-2100]
MPDSSRTALPTLDKRIMNGALLLVLMQPPSSQEEEFNDWYDTEHFPQRLALPGFLDGRRWVCSEGWPRYLALYELENEEVLNTAQYLSVSGARSTPWSRRILPRTVGRQRIVLRTCAESRRPGQAASLLLMSWNMPADVDMESFISAVDTQINTITGVLTRQWGENLTPLVEHGRSLSLIATFDYCIPSSALDAMRRPLDVGCTQFNLYLPYCR